MVQRYDIVRVTTAQPEWPNWVPGSMDRYVGQEDLYLVTAVGTGRDVSVGLCNLDPTRRYNQADAWSWPEGSLEVVEAFVDAEKVLMIYRPTTLPAATAQIHSGWSSGSDRIGLYVWPIRGVLAGIFQAQIGMAVAYEAIPMRSALSINNRGVITDNRGAVPVEVELPPEPEPDFDEEEEDF